MGKGIGVVGLFFGTTAAIIVGSSIVHYKNKMSETSDKLGYSMVDLVNDQAELDSALYGGREGLELKKPALRAMERRLKNLIARADRHAQQNNDGHYDRYTASYVDKARGILTGIHTLIGESEGEDDDISEPTTSL